MATPLCVHSKLGCDIQLGGGSVLTQNATVLVQFNLAPDIVQNCNKACWTCCKPPHTMSYHLQILSPNFLLHL